MRRRRSRRIVLSDRRRLTVRERITRFVRALFSSSSSYEPWNDDEVEGGIGVREPRRPRRPSSSGAVALEAPPDERRDVWAVGDEERS